MNPCRLRVGVYHCTAKAVTCIRRPSGFSRTSWLWTIFGIAVELRNRNGHPALSHLSQHDKRATLVGVFSAGRTEFQQRMQSH